MKRIKLIPAAALAVTALLAASGCTASFQAEPATVAYDDSYAEADVVAAPVNVEAYPRTYYRGSYVYLVDGRWVYPSNRGWRAYRREPVELQRYRTHVYTTQRVEPREHHYEVRDVNAYPRPTVRQRPR